jgi:hypothetical protein
MVIVSAVAEPGAWRAFCISKIQAIERDFEQSALLDNLPIRRHADNAAGTTHDNISDGLKIAAYC